MTPRDLFLRVTDKHGAFYVSHHRVWDAERFLESVSAHHAKEGGRVALSSEQAYRDTNWRHLKASRP